MSPSMASQTVVTTEVAASVTVDAKFCTDSAAFVTKLVTAPHQSLRRSGAAPSRRVGGSWRMRLKSCRANLTRASTFAFLKMRSRGTWTMVACGDTLDARRGRLIATRFRAFRTWPAASATAETSTMTGGANLAVFETLVWRHFQWWPPTSTTLLPAGAFRSSDLRGASTRVEERSFRAGADAKATAAAPCANVMSISPAVPLPCTRSRCGTSSRSRMCTSGECSMS
mmetsp:Transcript_23259/g.69665  ORF Transcript_23259/g.69665 Transcript_23259/m.69665 type:complete len:227 (-) Transcript_23259:32-712(-)